METSHNICWFILSFLLIANTSFAQILSGDGGEIFSNDVKVNSIFGPSSFDAIQVFVDSKDDPELRQYLSNTGIFGRFSYPGQAINTGDSGGTGSIPIPNPNQGNSGGIPFPGQGTNTGNSGGTSTILFPNQGNSGGIGANPGIAAAWSQSQSQSQSQTQSQGYPNNWNSGGNGGNSGGTGGNNGNSGGTGANTGATSGHGGGAGANNGNSGGTWGNGGGTGANTGNSGGLGSSIGQVSGSYSGVPGSTISILSLTKNIRNRSRSKRFISLNQHKNGHQGGEKFHF